MTTGNNNEWRTSKRCLSSDDERYTTKKKETHSSNASPSVGDNATSIIVGTDVENDGNNFEDDPHDCLEDNREEESEENKSDSKTAHGGKTRFNANKLSSMHVGY